jgi:hypothetical protein
MNLEQPLMESPVSNVQISSEGDNQPHFLDQERASEKQGLDKPPGVDSLT